MEEIIIKFYEVALFMIIFNLVGTGLISAGIFTNMGLSENIFTDSFEDIQSDITTIEQSINATGGASVSGDTPFEKLLGLEALSRIKEGVTLFTTLKRMAYLPITMLSHFNIAQSIRNIFSTILTFIYIIGFVQFLTGRFIKQAE